MEDPMDGKIAGDIARLAAKAKANIAGMNGMMDFGASPEGIMAALDTIGITREVRDIVDTTILGLIGGQFASWGIKAVDVDPLVEIASQNSPDDPYWFVPDDEMWTKVMALATLEKHIGVAASETYLRFVRNMISEYQIAFEILHLEREKAKGAVPEPESEEWGGYTAEMYAKYGSEWQEAAVAGVQFILKLTITTVSMAIRPG